MLDREFDNPTHFALASEASSYVIAQRGYIELNLSASSMLDIGCWMLDVESFLQEEDGNANEEKCERRTLNAELRTLNEEEEKIERFPNEQAATSNSGQSLCGCVLEH